MSWCSISFVLNDTDIFWMTELYQWIETQKTKLPQNDALGFPKKLNVVPAEAPDAEEILKRLESKIGELTKRRSTKSEATNDKEMPRFS